MRVLLVTGSYPPNECGVGDYCKKLAIALSSCTEITVGILTGKVVGRSCHGKISLIEVGPRWTIYQIPKIIEAILKWNPDIVHIQYPTQGYGNKLLPWVIPIIGFLLGKKIVQTWHEIFIPRHFFRFLLIGLVPGGLVIVRPEYEKLLCRSLKWGLRNKEIRFIKNASSIPHAVFKIKEAEALKAWYLKKQKRLITFFGFIYPEKGVELLFDIADPTRDQLVICGAILGAGGYQEKIYEKAASSPWIDKVMITGEVPADEVAKLLAISDAVVLPFKSGAGPWNTSIHAAQLQGTFVLTTSNTISEYDESSNTYYASVGNVAEMKSALNSFSGKKNPKYEDIERTWGSIAQKHLDLYSGLLSKKHND